MTLFAALEILARVHTYKDGENVMIRMCNLDPWGYGYKIEQYGQAWEVVRQHLGLPAGLADQ